MGLSYFDIPGGPDLPQTGNQSLESGADGVDGADGVGVPAAGTTGQVLAKASATDYDTEWITPAASGLVAWGDITGTVSNQTDLGSLAVLNTVGATQISTSAVIEAKIAAGAVSASKLADTAVTPGSYSAADVTVDQQGRITAASANVEVGRLTASTISGGDGLAIDRLKVSTILRPPVLDLATTTVVDTVCTDTTTGDLYYIHPNGTQHQLCQLESEYGGGVGGGGEYLGPPVLVYSGTPTTWANLSPLRGLQTDDLILMIRRGGGAAPTGWTRVVAVGDLTIDEVFYADGLAALDYGTYTERGIVVVRGASKVYGVEYGSDSGSGRTGAVTFPAATGLSQPTLAVCVGYSTETYTHTDASGRWTLVPTGSLTGTLVYVREDPCRVLAFTPEIGIPATASRTDSLATMLIEGRAS